MDKGLNMTYASSLTNLCEVNSSFDTGVLRICYTGENRNKSFLSKETITKSIPTALLYAITTERQTLSVVTTWKLCATAMAI